MDWQEAEHSPELVAFQSPDSRQRVTASVLQLAKKVTPAEFESICRHRLDAEKRTSSDCVLHPESPRLQQARDGLVFFYSGINKKSGRVFSGYMRPVEDCVFTLYVESIGIAAAEHVKSFAEIAKTVQHNGEDRC